MALPHHPPSPAATKTRRRAFLWYGALAYASFVGVYAALVAFVGNFGLVRGIDAGTPGPLLDAVVVDLGLVLLFGVSHSVLARSSVKRLWTRIVPPVIERSTYVLIASVVLAVMIWQWRPLPESLWQVSAPLPRLALLGLSLCGVAMMAWSTFLTDHFHLFGLRQVWLFARGRAYSPVPFRIHSLYRWMRHPMMTGVLVWMWATPDMTVGHMLLAASMSLYIVVGVAFEERALARELGRPYEAYRRSVRAFLPLPQRTRPSAGSAPAA